MDFHIVVLNDHVSSYPKIDWIEWKDNLSNKMRSQGDHWSKSTLSGENIWDCLDKNKINNTLTDYQKIFNYYKKHFHFAGRINK